MIFRLDFYQVNPETGSTDIGMAWDAGRGKYTDQRTFDTSQQANDYIFGSARDAIMLRFERYVKAIKNMADYDTRYYHTANKTADTRYLWRIISELLKRDLPECCKNIHHFRDKLIGILPGEQHIRYQILLKDIQDILAFAKENCEPAIGHFLPTEIAA